MSQVIRSLRTSITVAGLIACASAAPVSAQTSPHPDSMFTQLESQFLQLLVDLTPVHATLLGIHEGDTTLGPSGIEGTLETRMAWEDFIASLMAASDSISSADDRYDLHLMLHEARLHLFEIDRLRLPARDPGMAIGRVASGLYGLLAWNFAPLEDRVQSLILRLDEVPGYLEGSFRQLENPPRVLTNRALARADAVSNLLIYDLPTTTQGLADTALANRLTEAGQRALEAVWGYRERLVTEVSPRSTEGFALGPELFADHLRASEGIEDSIPELRRLAEAELERLDVRFREVAARIDSTRSPREVMYSVSLDHPPAESILVSVENAVAEAMGFVEMDSLLSDPKRVAMDIRPTPELSRWANASLATPGPFESEGMHSVFYVTLPDPSESGASQEERLRFMSRAVIRNLAIHEAFPGHGLQAGVLSALDRPIRRAVWSQGFVEGWAHYAESLMLERGFREGDDAFQLASIQSGLRRAGRFRVALGLHTEGWTLDTAIEFLAQRSYLEPSVARREAERGVVDPMYLVYTIGRLEMESLRKELELREGELFDIARFHQKVLESGAPPLPLLRTRMLNPERLGRYLD